MYIYFLYMYTVGAVFLDVCVCFYV
jgi:hypothetical protein